MPRAKIQVNEFIESHFSWNGARGLPDLKGDVVDASASTGIGNLERPSAGDTIVAQNENRLAYPYSTPNLARPAGTLWVRRVRPARAFQPLLRPHDD
jgi:hypothetical protein